MYFSSCVSGYTYLKTNRKPLKQIIVHTKLVFMFVEYCNRGVRVSRNV